MIHIFVLRETKRASISWIPTGRPRFHLRDQSCKFQTHLIINIHTQTRTRATSRWAVARERKKKRIRRYRVILIKPRVDRRRVLHYRHRHRPVPLFSRGRRTPISRNSVHYTPPERFLHALARWKSLTSHRSFHAPLSLLSFSVLTGPFEGPSRSIKRLPSLRRTSLLNR